MSFFRWFVDIWLRFSVWYEGRRDTIAGLHAEIARLRREKQLSDEDYRGQIKMQAQQIEAMAELHQKLRSHIKADIALNNRIAAEATQSRQT